MKNPNFLKGESRPLFFGLLISLFFNVFLLTHYIQSFFTPKTLQISKFRVEQEEDKWLPYSETQSAGEVLEKYQKLGFENLVQKLGDSDLIEYGYTQRDLALAILVNEFEFDLKRALKGQVLKKRIWTFGAGEKQSRLEVFPGLKPGDFERIIGFAKREKWPLTAKGLFHNLKKAGFEKEPSLLKAFCLSSEFKDLAGVFESAAPPIEKEEIARMLVEGEWELFKQFFQRFRGEVKENSEIMRSLLMEYVLNNSETAVKILLKIDRDFAVRHLPDEYTLHMLSLLSNPSDEAVLFLNELLQSPRNPKVIDSALRVLTKFEGKNLKKRPLPQESAKQALTYQVKEGDTLWSLSRMFGVSIETIRAANQLDGDFLKPGVVLKIPSAISADHAPQDERDGI